MMVMVVVVMDFLFLTKVVVLSAWGYVLPHYVYALVYQDESLEATSMSFCCRSA
jgi:hypothetical protein